MTAIDRTVQKEFAALGQAMSLYAAITRKSPEDIVKVKMGQIVLGTGMGEANKPGLAGLLWDTTPKRGRVTAERTAAGFRIGKPASTSLAWAKERAASMLGGRKSGAFRIRYSTSGGQRAIAGVEAGGFSLRGKQKGRFRFGGRGKGFVPLLDPSRKQAGAAGGSMLNRQALTVALAIARREKSRGATAAQVQPKRYRTLLARKPGVEYRGGQAVGISSTDLAVTHRHERVLVENRKGRALGGMDLMVSTDGAIAKLVGNVGVSTAAQRAAIGTALNRVTADIGVYVAGRTVADAKAVFKLFGFIAKG